MSATSNEAVTKTVGVEGTRFAYREVGPTTGVPVVFLHHFTAGLDEVRRVRGRVCELLGGWFEHWLAGHGRSPVSVASFPSSRLHGRRGGFAR